MSDTGTNPEGQKTSGEGDRLGLTPGVDAIEGSMFPYESASDHWDIDFADTSQSYEGSALPIWLLAGWAAFILWAVLYLVLGLPQAF